MAYEVEGNLFKIMPTAQITDSFKKREFVLELVDGAYTQLVSFQLTQDNCSKLDGLQEGAKVKATFNLRGREWINKEGVPKYFNSLDCWKIETVGVQPQAANPVTQSPPLPSDDDLPF